MAEPQQPLAAQSPGKIKIVLSRARATIGFVSWIFPLVIMVIGYAFFPALRAPVIWPWNAPPNVFGGLFAIFVLVVVWFVIEIYYAANRETSVRQLQADGLVSTFFAIALSIGGGAMISMNNLPWWYLLPWLGTIIDAFASGYFAVNNAAQKPLVQSEPR